MRIVIDSSLIVEKDWRLSRTHAEALLAASRNGRISLIVPEVVVREVVAAQRDRVSTELKNLRAAKAELARLEGRSEGPQNSAQTQSDSYEDELRQRLDSKRVTIAKVPEDTSAILDRALQRRRPFDSHGRNGFRDALIWQAVVEGASNAQTTIFATNNTKDFAEHPSDSLHQHLLDDLDALGIRQEQVRLALSLEAAVRLAIEPADEVLESLRERLTNEPELADALEQEMRSLIDDEGAAIDDVGVSPTIEASGGPFEDAAVDHELEDLEVTGEPSVSDAYLLTDDVFVVQLEIHGEARYTIEVMTEGFSHHPKLVPPGIVLSLDERSAYFDGFADIRVLFDARYRPSTGQLSDLSLTGLIDG